LYKNVMIASPMHVNEAMDKIFEYDVEEREKRKYDETIGVQSEIKNAANKQSIDELVHTFFNNRYYHLGDILFEIPDLYTAFDDFLKMKLSAESLHFLREVDNLYFDMRRGYNHSIAVKETRAIYRKFIADSAKQQINLSGNVFKQLHNDMRRINKFQDPLSIFDRARDQISQLIHKESLPNFYKSQRFKAWYQKQREKEMMDAVV